MRRARPVHADVVVSAGSPLNSVPTAIPIKKVHRRLIRIKKAGPSNNCHMLVAKDGIINNPAAVAGDIVNVSNPIAIVGKPRPITPFTTPAIRNTVIIVIKVASLFEIKGMSL
ncbi:hypothetical protein D3C75_872790 [compost metagenome]|nr:hypothetical protein [Serratia fonticola]